MQVMIKAVAPFMAWAGLLLNMLRSVILAIDNATDPAVLTASITFNGILLFAVLPADTAHTKVLGVFMALTGNYRERNE